eukprot:16300264-Heterocapsa_arctica.AAC.1
MEPTCHRIRTGLLAGAAEHKPVQATQGVNVELPPVRFEFAKEHAEHAATTECAPTLDGEVHRFRDSDLKVSPHHRLDGGGDLGIEALPFWGDVDEVIGAGAPDVGLAEPRGA